MADNLNAKSPKSTEKTKITNAVNRTTSETMRLGEPEKSVNHPTSLCTSTTKERKKTPAFQITSVTVGPRISNDGGDDSADDLDESHTDDISDVIDNSRITDIENETPSYSEDTFSKEEVFFNASNASLGTAPVIPTSSQYGLAIVGPEGGPNPQNPVVTCSNNVTNSIEVSTTSVSDTGNGTINIVNSVKPIESDMRDVHTHTARNERFKVVKIESTEPFKRGRWMCMDYLDHSMVQQQSQQAIIVKNEQSDAHTGSVQYVGPDSGVVLMDGLGVDHPNEHQNMPSGSEHHHQPPPMSQAVTNLSTSQNVPSGYTSSVSPGQTMQQMSMGIVHQAVPMGNEMPPHAQSMSQVPVVGMMQQQPTTMGQSLPPQQMQTLLQGYQQSGYYPSTQHLASQASSMPVQNQPLTTSIAQPISMQNSMTMTAPQQHIMTQPQYQTQPPQQQYQQAPQHLQQPQLSQPSPGMQAVPPTVQMTQPIQVSQPLPTQPIQVQVSQPIQPQPIQVQVSQPMQVHTQPVQVSQSMQVPSQPVPVQSSQSMQIPTQIHLQGQSQSIQVPHHMQAQSQPVQMSQQMQGVQVAQMSQQMQGQSQPMQVPQMQPQSQPIQVSQPMQNQTQQMQGPTQSMQSQSQPIQGQSQPLNPQSQQMQAQQMQAQSLQQQMQVQSQPVQVTQQIHAQSQPVQMSQMQAQSQPLAQQVQPQSQPVQVTQMQSQSQSVPHVQHVQQVQVSQMQAQSQPMQVPQMQAQSQPVQVQHQMQAQSQPLQVTTQMQSQSQPIQMPPQMQPHSQPVAVSQHMPVQPLPVSQPMTSQPMSVPIQQVPQQPMQQLHVVGVQSMVTPTSMSGMPTTPLPSGYVNAPSAVAGSVLEMAIHPEPVQEPPTGIQQDKAVAGDMVQSGPAGDDNPGPAANEEPESASGTSAVAIDNKIEQAMDLVKSHLMFAVREEVEVLKERIAELMERINQLELENTILKAHASQETLAQLGSNKGSVVASAPQQQQQQQQQPAQQQQQQQTPAQGPPVSQAQSGSAAPAAFANSGPAPNMV